MTMEPKKASPMSKIKLKWMELGYQVLLGHFGPVYLLQASKNDDEERCI